MAKNKMNKDIIPKGFAMTLDSADTKTKEMKRNGSEMPYIFPDRFFFYSKK